MMTRAERFINQRVGQVTVEQVEEVCPDCARMMRDKGIKYLPESVVREAIMAVASVQVAMLPERAPLPRAK